MLISPEHVEWWTAKLRASDRADVKLFYLGAIDSRGAATPESRMLAPDPLGLLQTSSADEGEAAMSHTSTTGASPSPAPGAEASAGAAWSLSRLLWAARLVSCDARTTWECVGLHFRRVFEQRVDGWNEQLAVKLVHYFLEAFAAEDTFGAPPLRTQLAEYAAQAIAPPSAQLPACEGLQARLDALAVAPSADDEAATDPTSAAHILRRAAATVVPMEDGDAHSEGCLACCRPVPPFGELLRVPREAMFFRETVLAHCPLARAMQRQSALFDSILSSEEALLVLSLVFEQYVLGPEQSHWAILLRGCPASYPTVPAFWSFTDLAALEGTDVLDDVISKKTELQSFHEQVSAALPVIHAALQREAAEDANSTTTTTTTVATVAQLSLDDLTTCFSYEALLWARATFDSRAFKLNIDGNVRLSLVPIADMINHGNRSDVLIRRVDEHTGHDDDDDGRGGRGGDFVMQVGAAVTEASVRTRRELWMSYGPLQNWELLQFYGFVLADNEHDKLPFPFDVPDAPALPGHAEEAHLEDLETESERLAWWQRRRQRLVERYSLFMANRCWVRASGVPCEALLAVLRVHLAQADEFPLMEAKSPFCPLSPATEASVLETVRETIACVLALFSTTLEEDDDELTELLELLHTASTKDVSPSNGGSQHDAADGDDEDEDGDDDPHAWDNYILSLRLRLDLKHIAQRTLEWCGTQETE